MKHLIITGWIVGLLFSCGTAFSQFASPPAEATAQIRKRADALLSSIHARQWTNCVSFVAVKKDSGTLRRMGLSKEASSQAVAEKIAAWFKGLYDVVQPGGVVSVRLRQDDKNLALVEYMHEDLDGFYMRRFDGEWYYTLDDRAEPSASANGASPRR